jgi:hypothetical protein
MGRRSVIKDLDAEQLDFVIDCIIKENLTDREISLAFEEKFGKKLAKSSLNRWRLSAGNELADRYQLARYQARQLLEHLKEDPNADKYQVIMRGMEDMLLTATREAIISDPVKMLRIRQEEEKRRLKEKELEVRKEHLQLEREKLRGVQVNRAELGVEFIGDFLEYLDNDVEGLAFFKRHAKKLAEFIKQKYAAPQTA